MRTLSSLLLVSLSIGVAAPVAAAPRVPVAGLPGVSDVLLNIAVAAPTVTWPNDSERPGSVLVFPKFIRGTFNDASTTGQAVHAITEVEISVVCPSGGTCAKNPVTGDFERVFMRAHWVCPGCTSASFDLETTINGSLYFNPEGVTSIGGVITANAFPSNATTPIPVPPCPRGFLIVWVTDGGGNPIKFDGLIGDAIIRDQPGDFQEAARAYNAIPIQASEFLNSGDLTDGFGSTPGGLDFDGSEYQAVTGKVFGTVRYENATFPDRVETDITLLTLDVALNRPTNPVTSVGLNFYTTDEGLIDAGTSLVCWREQRLTQINAGLTRNAMGRKGLVESTFAEQNGVPVTLLGVIESKEFFAGTLQTRDWMYSLYNDGNPVPTIFRP